MTLVFTVWSDVELHPAALVALDGRACLIGPGYDDPAGRIEQADGVLAGGGFVLTAAAIRHATRLMVVARLGTGFDNIDLSAATRHGVCITHTPDAPTESTAEYTVALMLSVSRRIKLADRALSGGRLLSPREATGFDLSGRTLGLVGLGRIGSRVAQLAQVFRMRVVACDPAATNGQAYELGVELADDLPTLLRQTDVLSMHVPLDAETRRLIGKQELALLRPGAIVVNVSRGPVLDTGALLQALDAGQLAGAAIDVWDTELPNAGHPLLHRDDVVATPHIAAMTDQGRARSNTTAIQQVLSVLHGERPPGLLNGDVWLHRRGLPGRRCR